MTIAKLRKMSRWIHLAGAALIGTYIYSPWGHFEAFRLLIQIGVVPALGITGLALWKPQYFMITKKH